MNIQWILYCINIISCRLVISIHTYYIGHDIIFIYLFELYRIHILESFYFNIIQTSCKYIQEFKGVKIEYFNS